LSDNGKKLDKISDQLATLTGTFSQYKKDMERRVNGIEESNGTILAQVNKIHVTCAERYHDIEQTKKDIKEHKDDHKEGASNKERWAIAGSYLTQIIVKLIEFLNIN